MKIAIVGGGIFGVAAALELRSRDHAVTLLDKGAVPSENASSNDVSKSIRRTWYADNETYVELVERSATQWSTWQKQFDSPIYHQVGNFKVLKGFEPGHPMYESLEYLRGRGATEIKVLSPKEAGARFPQFVINDDETCIADPWAGYLESGLAVSYLAQMARRNGVRIMEHTPVVGVEDNSAGAKVVLDSGPLMFDRVVVAAGVWLGELIPEIGRHTEVGRK